jgi:hypothetical protein
MGDYNIVIEHRPGATNRADPLSRCPDHDDGSRDNKYDLVIPVRCLLKSLPPLALPSSIAPVTPSGNSLQPISPQTKTLRRYPFLKRGSNKM